MNSPSAFIVMCIPISSSQHIVETQQQEHVFSEKRIMLSCSHQFIAKLFRTFRDRK